MIAKLNKQDYIFIFSLVLLLLIPRFIIVICSFFSFIPSSMLIISITLIFGIISPVMVTIICNKDTIHTVAFVLPILGLLIYKIIDATIMLIIYGGIIQLFTVYILLKGIGLSFIGMGSSFYKENKLLTIVLIAIGIGMIILPLNLVDKISNILSDTNSIK